MNIEDVLGPFSRKVASMAFPEINRGRSLSQMTADHFKTDVTTVHTVGLLAAGTIILLVNRKLG